MATEARLHITTQNGEVYENPDVHYGEIRDFLYRHFGYGAKTLTTKEEIERLARLYHKEVDFLEVPLELSCLQEGKLVVRKIYNKGDLGDLEECYYNYGHNNIEVYKTGLPYPTFESLAFPFFTHHIHELEGEFDVFDGDVPISDDKMKTLFHYLDNLFAGRLLFGVEVDTIETVEIDIR